MSSRERINALEALLSRVKSRAAMPRPARGGPPMMAAPPAPQMSRAPVPPPPAPISEPKTVPPEAYHDETIDEMTEVEVSSEVVEVDIDIDEESGSQRVAHPTTPPEELEELAPVTAAEPHGAANELEEEAPSSSPRPIERWKRRTSTLTSSLFNARSVSSESTALSAVALRTR